MGSEDEHKSAGNCFIICPLGDDGSAVRSHSDRLLNHVLIPVLSQFGLNVIRADQIPKAGLITTQVINLIIDSPFVVADLTGSNPNVFYELAIRHATRKPYVQLISKGERIPFDIGAVRTIHFDLADLDSVATAKKELADQVKEFQKGHTADSPISVATTSKLLQHDSDFADEIADRISFGGGEVYVDTSEIDYPVAQLLRKFTHLNDYSRVTFEDLDRKLDAILAMLSTGGE